MPPWSSPNVGPLPRNQVAMPSNNRVRRDERRHLSEDSASEPLPEHRETQPLPIVQVQTASRQLGFQHPILFPKKHDHIALLALEPSQQSGEEQLERKHAVSLRQGVARVFRHYGRTGKRLKRSKSVCSRMFSNYRLGSKTRSLQVSVKTQVSFLRHR